MRVEQEFLEGVVTSFWLWQGYESGVGKARQNRNDKCHYFSRVRSTDRLIHQADLVPKSGTKNFCLYFYKLSLWYCSIWVSIGPGPGFYPGTRDAWRALWMFISWEIAWKLRFWAISRHFPTYFYPFLRQKCDSKCQWPVTKLASVQLCSIQVGLWHSDRRS
jgi:hypothetical protein